MFGTIKAQLAEMTGFEVERGGRREGGGAVLSECLCKREEEKKVSQKSTVGWPLLQGFE